MHIVLSRTAGSPIQLAIEKEGVDYIFELINLVAPTINNLQYTNSNNNTATINVRTSDNMLLNASSAPME
jgi:hypothetical protein